VPGGHHYRYSRGIYYIGNVSVLHIVRTVPYGSLRFCLSRSSAHASIGRHSAIRCSCRCPQGRALYCGRLAEICRMACLSLPSQQCVVLHPTQVTHTHRPWQHLDPALSHTPWPGCVFLYSEGDYTKDYRGTLPGKASYLNEHLLSTVWRVYYRFQ